MRGVAWTLAAVTIGAGFLALATCPLDTRHPLGFFIQVMLGVLTIAVGTISVCTAVICYRIETCGYRAGYKDGIVDGRQAVTVARVR
jgi:hypothetical protein